MTLQTPGQPGTQLPSVVLLVEDNPLIAMNTEEMLQELGIGSVHTAMSVAEALALMQDTRFDLALLDLRLSDDEDSLPVAERLMTDGVPIVFATGFGEELELPGTFQDVPILKKPYSYEDLKYLLVGS